MRRFYLLLPTLLLFAGIFPLPKTLAQPPTEDCTTAPILCDVNDLDGYTFTMTQNITANGPSPLCPQGGAPDNVNWFAFYTWCPNLSLTLNPSNCVASGGQEGIQAAVYYYGGNGLCPESTWQPQEIIACNVLPCFTQPWQIEMNLQVGKIYYFMVDGCAGSYCDISFELHSVCPPPQIGNWPGAVQGNTYVCNGATTTYYTPQPQGAVDYSWYVNGLEVQFGPTNLVDITWTEVGTYEICVKASNQCVPLSEGPGPNCITVEVYDVLGIDPDPRYVCEGQTTPWPGGPFGPGEWIVNLVTPDGCDSIITLRVLLDPTVYYDLGRYYICEGDSVEVEGELYDCSLASPKQVYFQKDYPPYCDSFVVFEIVCFEAVIQPHDTLGPGQPTVLLDGDLGANAVGGYFTYQWTTTTGQLPAVTDQPTLQVSFPGTYCLLVSMYGPDSTLLCMDSACTLLLGESELPAIPHCHDAAFMCFPNFIYSLKMSPEMTFNGPSPMCVQGGAPHNTHWLAFYAPCESIQIMISPSNCQIGGGGQMGVQAAVYRYGGNGECIDPIAQPDQILACQSIPCFINPWTLSPNNLEVGGLYYLFLDGCAGAYCDLQIAFATNCNETEDPFVWEGSLSGPADLCEDETGYFHAPRAPVLSRYLWFVNDSLVASTPNESIALSWNQSGEYTLCVTWEHPCLDQLGKEVDPLCTVVQVDPHRVRGQRDIYVCRDDFVAHHGVLWSCDFAGQQEIRYQMANEPFCDSIVRFNVVCLSPEVVILPPDPLSPGDSVVVLDGSGSYPGPPGAVTVWEWTAYNGGTLDGPTDQSIAYATSTGQYCLVITASSPNGAVECSDFGCVTVTSFDSDANPRFGMEEEMWVFPSPASDRVWVQFSESMSSSGLLLVHNSAGQEVYRMVKPALQSQLEITVARWTPGLYTVSLLRDNADKLISQRLVILR